MGELMGRETWFDFGRFIVFGISCKGSGFEPVRWIGRQ
jgi:hypothetical protein